MIVKQVEPRQWSNLSEISGNASVCHQPEFISATAISFGLEPIPLVVFKDEEKPLFGLLAFKKKSL